MKPENANRLDIDCDLSLYSYEKAINSLPTTNREFFETTEIVVPSQLIITAYMISHGYERVYVDLSLTYDQDEWSVKRVIYDGPLKGTYEVWSAGA